MLILNILATSGIHDCDSVDEFGDAICPRCDGRGYIFIVLWVKTKTCPECDGSGKRHN
ncbi:MAG: hypothetical protein HOA57_01170 [Candidatus Magasanikbacteria bacterium]|nr:hypothetical protein [Candidatus Magasanikbacteria bacterium]MBT4315033.1 hypothetical protein [Candidatus Magasanikbacteria bacterium]MBT4546812.1 hypothetical protein [Candidatus Magasanikbacteria bacterium]MBT6818977.1 hypothetical protein [Candidatus Magasanikbacteria bacterium]